MKIDIAKEEYEEIYGGKGNNKFKNEEDQKAYEEEFNRLEWKHYNLMQEEEMRKINKANELGISTMTLEKLEDYRFSLIYKDRELRRYHILRKRNRDSEKIQLKWDNRKLRREIRVLSHKPKQSIMDLIIDAIFP